MIPRYAIIDVEERDDFEKKTHLPYGYSNCFITHNLNYAIDRFMKYKYEYYKGHSIERIDEHGREVVYS